KCRKKLGLIVVDYLELFHGCYNEKEHYIRFSDAIKKFKKLVNELKVPVVLLCELARDVEYNSDNRPVLKNISWKFDIDKADKIVFLYRDSYYNPNSKIPNVMELITAKNKNGKPGVIEFHSDYSLK
ncbi:MAG: replicative DNA helicase, partial [Oscillospiraceae bacterium]|nr:replicative DNA helicase [Oscillospiraceae bacterium]